MTTPTTPEQARELANDFENIDHWHLTGVKLQHGAEILRSLAQQVEALTTEREELQRKLYEDKHCQCGYDDVCEFARERDSFEADAKRYQLLAAYIVGPCTDADDQIIACKTVDQVSAVIDAMKAAS